MTPKIVWLNGPPRSGKDTLGKLLVDHYREIPYARDAATMKLAQPIKDGIKAFLGIPEGVFNTIDVLGIGKEDPKATPLTFGKSLRECQIAISEQFAKPFWGKKIFGELLLERMRTNYPICSENALIFVTDAGFDYECEPVINYYGPENNVVVQLERSGTDYSRDSRSYIDLRYLGVDHIRVSNNGSLNETLNTICSELKEIKEWNL